MRGFFVYAYIIVLCWLPSAFALNLKISVQEGFDKLQSVAEVQTFLTEAFAPEDITLTFYPLPFARSSTLVNRGELDGELLRAANIVEDFKNIFLLPQPLVFVSYRAVFHEKSKHDGKNLVGLKGVVLLNSATTRDELRRRNLIVNEVPSIAQGLEMVRTRRVDYIIFADPVIESVRESDPRALNQLRLANEQFQKIPLYFCLNKKHAALFPRLESALKSRGKKSLQKFRYLPSIINPEFLRP